MFLAHVLKSDDPRIYHAYFVIAEKKEVEGLKCQKNRTAICTENFPNKLTWLVRGSCAGRKNYLTPDETAKVRYVTEVLEKSLKGLLAHNVAPLRPGSIRLILSIRHHFTLFEFWAVTSHKRPYSAKTNFIENFIFTLKKEINICLE